MIKVRNKFSEPGEAAEQRCTCRGESSSWLCSLAFPVDFGLPTPGQAGSLQGDCGDGSDLGVLSGQVAVKQLSWEEVICPTLWMVQCSTGHQAVLVAVFIS